MSKQYRKPASKPRGFSPSCINERRWDRTVYRVIDGRSEEKRKANPKFGFEESANAVDTQLNPIKQIYPRRQENLITKFERNIPAMKIGHLTSNKVTVTQSITEDFVGNALDAFERKFDVSNRLICYDLVVALNPNHAGKVSQRDIAMAEKDYADSLEWYNLCRNCRQPIKARKASFDDWIKFSDEDQSVTERKATLLDKLNSYRSDLKGDIDAGHRVKLYASINRIQSELAELYKEGGHLVAEIPAHHEVYFRQRGRCYKYHLVDRKTVFNSKCSCMFSEVRKQERAKARLEGKDITL